MAHDREGPAAQPPAAAPAAAPAPPAPGRQTLTQNPAVAHPGNAERAAGHATASGSVAAPGAPHADPRSHEAAAPQAIAPQFPHGITVAIALAPADAAALESQILAHRAPDNLLSALLRRNGSKINAGPQRHRLFESLRRSDHVVTPEEAHDCAIALIANDRAFIRAAQAFASGHQVVGGDPASPQVGQPIIFHETDNAIAMVRQLSHTVGPLPGSHDPGNIRHLAIFTHGGHAGLTLGTFRGGAHAFVSALSGLVTHDITIGMYGCNAAGQDEHHPDAPFAQNVTEGLAQAGHDVRVFGHDNADHTTLNPLGREFRATAGQTTPATGHSNHDMVFSTSYRAQEVARLARELSVQPAEVDRVFEATTRRWLINSMPNIRVRNGQAATFQIGFDPDSAIAACREAWQTQGLAAIQRALNPTQPEQPARPAHRRHRD